MRYLELYQQGREALMQAGIDEASLDARLLLEFCCETDHNTLLVHPELEIEAKQEIRYNELIVKRRKHVPLQYLTGQQEFMGLSFLVNENVLVPRQDTEILVEEVLREPFDGADILDMCTGSGCILLSLLHYSNECHGVGVDLSPLALEVAKKNAERLGITQTHFVESDLFERVEGKFDILVSNPPYICSSVIPMLMTQVRDYEPIMALDGKEDGLFFYRRIIEEAKDYLRAGARLYFEIGYDQAEAVSGILGAAGYEQIKVCKDYAGLDRVVSAVLV